MTRFLFLFSFSFFVFVNLCSQETSVISNWKSGTKYGNVKEGRVFECTGVLKLGAFWSKDKPELLLKTLDKDGLIMQTSEAVEIGDAGSFKVVLPKIKDFDSYKFFLRHKNMSEVFVQTFKKRSEAPEGGQHPLMPGEVKIDFKKKAEVLSSKSGNDCTIIGHLVNNGGRQGTGVKVTATLKDALGKKLKTVDFIVNDENGNPVVFDGSDVYAFKEVVKDVKGFAGATFSLAWEGDDVGKEIVVDNGQVGLAENTFEFDKVVGDASITKITTKFEGTDLTLKIELFNDLDKNILNPVIEIKLTNSKGEVIQPLTSTLEGELSPGQKFEFSTVHKNAPQFSGILQSIRYSTKK